MMIARFRAVGWVASCAGAALCCYLAAQRVASERLALAKVEHEIALTAMENGRLETEIRARSRPGQIERWNAEFRLSAAAPSQMFASGVRLASFVEHRLPLDRSIVAGYGAVQQVAYQKPVPVTAPVVQTPAVHTVAVVTPATPAPRPAQPVLASAPAAEPAPMLRQASFVRTRPDRLAPSAPPLVKASLALPAPHPATRLAGLLDEPAPRSHAAVAPSLIPSDLARLAAAEGKVGRKTASPVRGDR